MESKAKKKDSTLEKLESDGPDAASIIEKAEKPLRRKKSPLVSKKKKGDSALEVPAPLDKPEAVPVPGAVNIEVESQSDDPERGDFASLLKRAANRGSINSEDEPEPSEPRRSRGKAVKKSESRDELTTLVFTVITLVISISNFPESIRPEEDEVKALGYYISGLMIRNLNISGRLGENTLDIIGILGVVSMWFMRVGPEIKRLRAEQQKESKPVLKRTNGSKPEEPGEPGLVDPITISSPGAGAFLDSAHKKAGSNNDNLN